jgi:peptidoglycan-associated lipoprotein
MPRWFIFFCLVVLSIPFFATVGTSWAQEDSGVEIDLQKRTHPYLFTWKWSVPPTPDSPTIIPPVQQPEKFEEPGITEHPTWKNKPIPLDELDSSLVQRVHFAYDKSDITPKTEKEIKINAEWLKNHPEYDILLEGHCDERGSNEYNLALGERRAEAVMRYLVQLGIDPNRISTRSWGEEKPLDLRKTEKSYAINRRAEFYAIPK